MCIFQVVLLLLTSHYALAQPGKCDQTPRQATIRTPSDDMGLFKLNIEKSDARPETRNLYTPAQTYVLRIQSTNTTRPFRWFMITAEDPEVDNGKFDNGRERVDVGSLKTIDTNRLAQYSERCFSTVENADNSDKTSVEVHWVSPRMDSTKVVRIRAMVAENSETWYIGKNLTLVLERDNEKSMDTPPLQVTKDCNLCSEARYEVLFNGKWSRVSHPQHYPSKPDENGYSHLVGASHGLDFTLWQPGGKASPGLKVMAEQSDVSVIEREIINNMTEPFGTRTLIRGRRRHHPHMFEPSHALFRVDKAHHLFSLVVALRPSPDWFLGTSKFELCTPTGWLESHKMPLYPWDAGTMNGVSYESETTVTQPVDTIQRVEVGSFNRESPFYQINLNDLKPFAILTVKRLDVYPLTDCTEDLPEDTDESKMDADSADEPEEPTFAESRQKLDVVQDCDVTDWGQWSPCVPEDGICGAGARTRTRAKGNDNMFYQRDGVEMPMRQLGRCESGPNTQSQYCFVDCI